MRQLVDAAAEALVVVDEHGCLRFANREARELFGDDVLASGSPAPFPLGADEVAEFSIRNANGHSLTLERRAAPVQWDGGNATLYTLRNLSALRSTEEHLVHVNRLYAALAQTSHVCARALSAEDLFEDVCRICVAHGGFRLGWIVRPKADNSEIEIVAAAGPALAYLQAIRVRLTPDHPESRGPIAQALRLGIQYVCNDFVADPLTRPWHAIATEHGIRSCAITPIHTGPITELALAVHSDEVNYFTSDLQTLLKQIADEIASGLERIAARTARRRAEQALIESEARFRQMTRVNPQVFWMRDAATHALLYVSPALERVFGIPSARITAEPQLWNTLVHPDDREAVEAFRRDAGKHGDARKSYRIRRPDGSQRWVREEIYAVRDGARLSRIAGTITDVTDEHCAREELLQREERLREQAMLLDAANDAIILTSLENNILYWNHGAQRMLGWGSDEVTGQNAASVFLPDLRGNRLRTSEVLASGIWQGELNYRRKDGETVVVDSRWTLIRNEQGQPRAILSINTDITERKRIESNLLRAQRLESIGTLASGIAHDLNNIFSPIMLSADVMRERLGETPEIELIDMISANAQRGSEIVRQVLSFARGYESSRAPVNFRHLFAEIGKIVCETFPKTITFKSSAPKDLSTVIADPTQLHQVLLNLCVNARDAMPTGGVISLEAEQVELDAMFAGQRPGARPGTFVRVRVSDTGTGIPPEIRDRIFEPFFTTKKAGAGTGLGLATVREIVQNHGGFISVESTPGEGTTFVFHIPAHEPKGDAAQSRAIKAGHRGNGELILVIDDEKSVAEITCQTLDSCGYRVISASDGAEGVSKFVERRDEIALVITDMMMPVMDGATAIHTLRRISPDLPIILMSGASRPQIPQRGDHVDEAVDFLLKPFTLETLLKSVNKALRSKAQARA